MMELSSKYVIHTVGPGDTVQSLGQLYNVEWTQIVSVNGLEYPFIDDDMYINENLNNDFVAKVGSKLIIPTNDIDIPIKHNNTSDEVENYAFGADLDIYSFNESPVLSLEEVGELSDDNHGDILVCSGLKNLRQQLITRLGTPKGALLLHPEFGSNITDYIGKRMTTELLTKIKLEVQECLLSDFRVSGVSNITVIGKDSSIYIECFIQPIEPYDSNIRISHTFTS